MKACYNKLLKMLIDREMTKTDLRQQAKISSSTLAKIGKQEMVSSDVLVKICNALQCDISDIVELVKDENEEYIAHFHPDKLKVVSLFSGAGGMDLGFIKAGFEIIWANDFFEDAVNSYRKNIGKHMIHGDITKISSCDIPDGADVVIGGFPCQGFSVANTRRSMEDKRNFLYKEMLRVIADKKPKFFVAENVKGLLSIEGGKVFEMIKSDFENLKDTDGNIIGYKVDARILNAAEYGVPQARERVVIIGNRIGVENPYPVATHYVEGVSKCSEKLLPAITTEQAISFLSDKKLTKNIVLVSKEEIDTHIKKTGLSDVEGFYSILGIDSNYNEIFIKNHIASENVADTFWGRKYEVNQHDICDYLRYWRGKAGWTTKRVDEHFGYAHTAGHWFRKDNNSGSIPKPEDWWELKKILGFDDKYDEAVTTLIEKEIQFEQSLRITNWDRPSDTITATSPEIHVNKMRRLSARECAILQTFPLEYEFTGSLNKMYTQIGNAVPVKLATKIAEGIYKAIEDDNQ
ncbi:DNA (cytosine-5)-methyltransferase 1 [Clostridium grantii DSM 8605]|uniref:Cytosine-specific methyltransferase n=1 Tax=Clostridium grantii DSM 8605 TaxID=1121316 RepID=A0A1M5U724_9CLOT|nr:DNA (cytosine-5-)-methyltransferase [Clostridium grantii]SHH58503.1 DNA (cytosine-5)-methyltransferase 1 [Clostridium grantii DSM 8605]